MKPVLLEELIETDVCASSWQEAIQKAGALLVKKQTVTEAFIQDMIDTVHKFGPYMILLPDVAFFHGPPSDHVLETSLSLITLQDDVFFKEYENQRIRCAFAFGAKDNASHMAMLQEVVKLLQDEAFLSLLTNHGSKEDIVSYVQNHMQREENI